MCSAQGNKYKWRIAALAAMLSLCRFAPADTAPETTTSELAVRVVAEVQTHVADHGSQYAQMVPADNVVPGDLVYYTLEVRNRGARSLQSPSVVQAIPVHMVYVPNSASGPGCEISYSVDGGRSFGRPESLKFTQPDGSQRPALARDYTHVRYRMASLVRPNSVAFMRFRARVK